MTPAKETPAAPPARQSQLGDPDYNFASFTRELLGGSLRWPATVLAVVAAVLLYCILAELLPPDMFWPIRARGATATGIAIFALIFWSALAAVNWIAHTRRRASVR